jgi:hypothetical protein
MEANRESLQHDAEEVDHEEVRETQASSGAPTYLCPVCGNQVVDAPILKLKNVNITTLEL